MKPAMLISRILGRNLAHRVGRALYMQARGDIANDMATNGERMVQGAVVAAARRARRRLICFDVGANVGKWSATFVEECGRQGVEDFSVHAFEPVVAAADAFDRLLGADPRVRCERVAVSSATGQGDMFIAGDTAGTNSMYRERPSAEAVSVPKTTAAEYCARRGIPEVHLLKCDTEGHDMEVIAGAAELLRAGRVAVLQFEYNHRWVYSRHYLKDAFDMAEEFGYRLGKVGPRALELYQEWSPEHERFFEANYALIRHDALGWFRTHECMLAPDNTFASTK